LDYPLLIPLAASFIGFVGYILGGLLGFFTHYVMKSYLVSFQTFAGGLLVGIILFELLPETMQTGDQVGILIGIGFGFFFMKLLDCFLHERMTMFSTLQDQNWHSYLFLMIGILVHNFPTGLSIGTAVTASENLFAAFLFILFLHHIPEGMALIVPLFLLRKPLIIFVMSAIGLAVVLGLGTWIGISVGLSSNGTFTRISTWLMGCSVGMVSFVALHEILWKTYKQLSFFRFTVIICTAITITKAYFTFF
jgi:zinc transporter, ZIP family